MVLTRRHPLGDWSFRRQRDERWPHLFTQSKCVKTTAPSAGKRRIICAECGTLVTPGALDLQGSKMQRAWRERQWLGSVVRVGWFPQGVGKQVIGLVEPSVGHVAVARPSSAWPSSAGHHPHHPLYPCWLWLVSLSTLQLVSQNPQKQKYVRAFMVSNSTSTPITTAKLYRLERRRLRSPGAQDCHVSTALEKNGALKSPVPFSMGF